MRAGILFCGAPRGAPEFVDLGHIIIVNLVKGPGNLSAVRHRILLNLVDVERVGRCQLLDFDQPQYLAGEDLGITMDGLMDNVSSHSRRPPSPQ